MNRIRRTLGVPMAAPALLAVAAAGPVAAVAPDTAGCAGQYASTGGSTAGADFGVLISGFALLPGPFGEVVAVEAQGDPSSCPFPRE